MTASESHPVTPLTSAKQSGSPKTSKQAALLTDFPPSRVRNTTSWHCGSG